MYFFPLILLQDIVSIDRQIDSDTENHLSVRCQAHYDITDKNNVSFEVLNIHDH